MGYVYGLISTRELQIRYVGSQKDGPTWKRLDDHDRGVNSSPEITRWKQVERWLGYHTRGVIIEDDIADKGRVISREAYWTARFPGLLNMNGTRSPPHPLSYGDKILIDAVLEAARPSYVENYDGLVGLTHHPGEGQKGGRWSVVIIDIFGHCWGAVDRHFSDVTEAKNFRDKQREMANQYYAVCLGIQAPWPLDGFTVRGRIDPEI